MNIVEFTSLSNKPIRMIEGEIIFQAGDPALNICFVDKGRVDIITLDGEKRLRTYDAGSLFGIPEVMSGINWPAMAIFRGFGSVRLFPGQVLMEKIDALPDDHKNLIASLSSKVAVKKAR
tara:strand:- start:234 stop:593 length:360 start_codon:yes stop_codon:yes gene_type:complete